MAAREAVGSDIVIIAGMDTLQSLRREQAVGRLEATRECEAEIGFLERVRWREEAVRVSCAVRIPVLLDMVYRGSTPDISREKA